MGLLSALSGMMGPGGGGDGGLLSGIHDYLSGTTPEVAINPGAITPASGGSLPMRGGTGFETQGVPAMGAIQAAPTITPTGNTTGGLLSKLQAPDGRGLTFGDKLFAAGNVLQGDSGGAATYLQNQRANAQNEDDRMTARRNQLAGAKAFRNNLNPDGSMNFQGYANDLGDELDPAKAVALRKGMGHEYQLASLANGGAGSFDPTTGKVTEQIAGQRKAPDGYSYNADGTLTPIDPNYVAGQKQIYGDRYTEQRLNRTFAPRSGGSGGSHIPRGATAGLPR